MFLFIDILFVTIRNQCQSDKSVFEKKLSGETNTDLSDYADASLVGRYWLPARSPVLWCPSEQELQLFHINSHISDSFLLKNKMLKCNSTLPPQGSYRFDNQEFICGGIIGGIRVELREVPP